MRRFRSHRFPQQFRESAFWVVMRIVHAVRSINQVRAAMNLYRQKRVQSGVPQPPLRGPCRRGTAFAACMDES